MKNINNFKPWTLEEVRTVINEPKVWAWSQGLSKKLGRSPKAIAFINTAFNAWTRGNKRYMTPALESYFKIITDPVKNAQNHYVVEAIMLPPIQKSEKRPFTASEIAERIEVEIKNIKTSFVQLGEAIVKEQYASVNKELEQRAERIQELEAQLEEANKRPERTSIKSLFNIS